jgi:hypothetical protein
MGVTGTLQVVISATATAGAISLLSTNTNGTIEIRGKLDCSINTTNGDGVVNIGNITNRARAVSQTIIGDDSRTLTTKGYVDGASSSWVGFTPFSGTWVSGGSSTFRVSKNAGIVYFSGSITPGASPQTLVGTIPNSWAPAYDTLGIMWYSASAGAVNGIGFWQIQTNGSLSVWRMTSAYPGTIGTPANGDIYEMGGISFPDW